jgi:hypothetical protein
LKRYLARPLNIKQTRVDLALPAPAIDDGKSSMETSEKAIEEIERLITEGKLV